MLDIVHNFLDRYAVCVCVCRGIYIQVALPCGFMPQALVFPSVFDWHSAMSERVCSFVHFHVVVCEQYFHCFLGVSFGYMRRKAS